LRPLPPVPRPAALPPRPATARDASNAHPATSDSAQRHAHTYTNPCPTQQTPNASKPAVQIKPDYTGRRSQLTAQSMPKFFQEAHTACKKARPGDPHQTITI